MKGFVVMESWVFLVLVLQPEWAGPESWAREPFPRTGDPKVLQLMIEALPQPEGINLDGLVFKWSVYVLCPMY